MLARLLKLAKLKRNVFGHVGDVASAVERAKQPTTGQGFDGPAGRPRGT
jgi:hypothetical protein